MTGGAAQLRALDPFFALATALRQAGFAVAPDQTQGFIAAVGALGPRSIEDVRAAARALFAIPPERMAEFDALFDALFSGRLVAADAEGDEDDVEAHELTGDSVEIEAETGEEPSGLEATETERLSSRPLRAIEDDLLTRFARAAPEALPRRLSYRHVRSRKGARIDPRRLLRQAARRDGEVLSLPRTRRKTRQRRVVLLVDVSGSMQQRADAFLRFAHALVHAAERAEVFTLGTRLTRVTPALRLRDRDPAMARTSEAVADLDGGTRIGEALGAFLDVPRYAGFARGALVLVLSDGLERGDPAVMVAATARLSRLAWRLHWLSPLAADPQFRPETAAMRGAAPWLDALADGGSTSAVCSHILDIARSA